MVVNIKMHFRGFSESAPGSAWLHRRRCGEVQATRVVHSPRDGYGRIADWFGLPLPPAALDAAVAATSVDAMRSAEKAGELPGAAKQRARISGKEPPKVRSGEAGGFLKEMEPAALRAWNASMRRDLPPELLVRYGFCD